MPGRRRVFVTLAALALAAVLLRPACEAWFAHVDAAARHATVAASVPPGHDADRAAQCCADIRDAHQIAPLHVVTGTVTPLGDNAPAMLAALAVGILVFPRQPRWLRAPPRSPQSFYLRSARILR